VHLFRGEEPTGPENEVPGSTTDRRALIAGVRAAQELTRGQPWRESRPGPVTYVSGETKLDSDDPLETTEDTRARKRDPSD
jgi:hypothetical protein